MRAFLLFFIATSAVAGPKKLPPPDVLARFEARAQAEIEKWQPSSEPKRERKMANVAVDAPLEDQTSCTHVGKYALAIGMLNEAGISLAEIPRQEKQYDFDAAAVQASIYAKSKNDWGQRAAFVKWNCEQLGVKNLKTALEF